MNTALVFIDMPKDVSHLDGRQRWQGFLGDILSAKELQEDIEKPSENCWLLPLNNGASALAALVSHADGRGLGHRILFFEKPPQWVTKSPVA